MSLNHSVIFSDVVRLLSEDNAQKLDEHIRVCQSYRTDLDEDNSADSLINVLMKPCYKFSKLAK
jgi:hypothetical protein